MKLLSLFFIFFISVSCSKNDSRAKKKNELNYALFSNVSTLDPATSYDTISGKVVYQIYESLYEYDYLITPYQIKPLLAEAMPVISSDKLTYTIKIKKNIKYHNAPFFNGTSRTLKAQDFINQIKRLALKSTKSNGWWLFENKILGLDEFRKKAKNDLSNFFDLKVAGLQAIDDHTLVIKLKKVYPQLNYALAMSFTAPMPKEAILYYKNDLSSQPIGTGPYEFVKWNRSLDIKLKRFKDYHGSKYPSNGDRYANQNDLLKDRGKDLPFIDKINFYVIKEDQTRWLKFLNKEIDILILKKDHFPLALNKQGSLNDEFMKKDIKLQIAPTLTYWWLSFNMKHPFLGKNLNFRKAVAHAINIDDYILKFTNNIGLKANSIYPPGVPGYSPSNSLPYSYNPEKAKKFLALAGFPKGKGLPVFNYDIRSSATNARQMGEFIQRELAKVGIKVNLNMNTFPGFLNKARTGQLEIWQGGWAMDYPDPENVIQLLISKNHPPGPNASSYSNKRVDALYNELPTVRNLDDMLKITNEVQDIITRDIPWVMQYFSRDYFLYHGYVKNFRQSDLVNNNFKYLRVK